MKLCIHKKRQKKRDNIEKPFIIVGLDPGLYTGIAILDLEGRLLIAKSWKQLGEKSIVELLERYGTPVIIATDVEKPPAMVSLIAARFGATLIVPTKNISKARKDSYRYKISDVHARDAYAAARMAFSKYANRFRSIKKKYNELAEKAMVKVVKKERAADIFKKKDSRASQNEKH